MEITILLIWHNKFTIILIFWVNGKLIVITFVMYVQSLIVFPVCQILIRCAPHFTIHDKLYITNRSRGDDLIWGFVRDRYILNWRETAPLLKSCKKNHHNRGPSATLFLDLNFLRTKTHFPKRVLLSMTFKYVGIFLSVCPFYTIFNDCFFLCNKIIRSIDSIKNYIKK